MCQGGQPSIRSAIWWVALRQGEVSLSVFTLCFAFNIWVPSLPLTDKSLNFFQLPSVHLSARKDNIWRTYLSEWSSSWNAMPGLLKLQSRVFMRNLKFQEALINGGGGRYPQNDRFSVWSWRKLSFLQILRPCCSGWSGGQPCFGNLCSKSSVTMALCTLKPLGRF